MAGLNCAGHTADGPDMGMFLNAVLVAVAAIITAAFTGFYFWKAHERDKERDRLARERDRASERRADRIEDGRGCPAQKAA